MSEDTNNKRVQTIIFIVSIFLIIAGFITIFTTGFENLI